MLKRCLFEERLVLLTEGVEFCGYGSGSDLGSLGDLYTYMRDSSALATKFNIRILC